MPFHIQHVRVCVPNNFTVYFSLHKPCFMKHTYSSSFSTALSWLIYLHEEVYQLSMRSPLLDETPVQKKKVFYWCHGIILHAGCCAEPGLIASRTSIDSQFDSLRNHQIQSCWSHSGFRSFKNQLFLLKYIFLNLFSTPNKWLTIDSLIACFGFRIPCNGIKPNCSWPYDTSF